MVEPAFHPTPGRITIDIWSDVMCPFCYLGDGMLASAMTEFPHRDKVDVIYHSYQLMPDLPADTAMGLYDLLERHRGYPRAQAQRSNAQIAERGREVGLDYRFEVAIGANTFRAHELTHFAKAEGKQHEMITALFKAYFTDGINVGDTKELLGLAESVGLDREAAAAALESGEYKDAVNDDIVLARQLGINGVPFFVFNGKYAVSGAQPRDTFSQVLNTVWNETAAEASNEVESS